MNCLWEGSWFEWIVPKAFKLLSPQATKLMSLRTDNSPLAAPISQRCKDEFCCVTFWSSFVLFAINEHYLHFWNLLFNQNNKFKSQAETVKLVFKLSITSLTLHVSDDTVVSVCFNPISLHYNRRQWMKTDIKNIASANMILQNEYLCKEDERRNANTHWQHWCSLNQTESKIKNTLFHKVTPESCTDSSIRYYYSYFN